MKINFDILFAALAIVISLLGLYWSIIQRTRLDRQKYAVDMIKEWNTNTFEDTNIIRSFYPDNYDKCEPIMQSEIDKIIHSVGTVSEKKYAKLRAAIFRLLNYFEFVAAAYNRGTVDGKIIRNSFSITMLRYYVVLRNFLIEQFLQSKRNHWRPFTLHLKNLLENREELICAGCDKNNCILKYDKDDAKLKLLDLLNSKNLMQEQMKELERQLNVRSQNQ